MSSCNYFYAGTAYGYKLRLYDVSKDLHLTWYVK